MNNINILKFIKFCLVGLSGTIIDFGITYILKEKLKIQQYIANAGGFIIAASSNYILNRIWTFESQNSNITSEYGNFIIISIIGLGINSFILWILVHKLKRNFYISKIIATVVTTIWNFLANLLFTFN